MRDRYVAQMLRLWQTGVGESTIWRASLEDPHTGEVRSFASLEALFQFLMALTCGPHDGNGLGGEAALPSSSPIEAI